MRGERKWFIALNVVLRTKMTLKCVLNAAHLCMVRNVQLLAERTLVLVHVKKSDSKKNDSASLTVAQFLE
jgi:hypothetical protein